MLTFSNLSAIGVVSARSKTEFHVGDGTAKNAGFEGGELLVMLQGTTSFSAANIENKSVSSNTAEFWFT